MYLVFLSYPYKAQAGAPTLLRSSSVRNMVAHPSWLKDQSMLAVHTTTTLHYTSKLREATNLTEALRLLADLEATGTFSDTPRNALADRISTILASGKRPTKTQLRKALDGF
jgi:hypothetical protein